MAVEIREVQVEDYEAIRAVWEASEWAAITALASAEAWARFLERNRGLSIGAFDGTDLLGVVISEKVAAGAFRERLALIDPAPDEATYRRLVDKAQLKITARGRNSCRIELPEHLLQDGFWQSIKWTDHGDGADELTVPLPESDMEAAELSENVAPTPQSP